MPHITVLVLANDVLGAALLGAMVDATGGHALFPRVGEPAIAAMRRLRPAVALLETGALGADQEATFQDVYHRAAGLGVVLLLFAPGQGDAALAALAKHRGVPTFAMPVAPEPFRQLLADAEAEWTTRHGEASARRVTDARDSGE
jgi:hypothetical protein